jgi:hypothetical protein
MRRALPPGARPELQLLLACAATPLESEPKDAIRRLAQPNLDWAYLLWAGSGHGLLPLLYRQLSAVGAEDVPPEVLDDLRVLYQRNLQRSRILSEELCALLALLEAAGIMAIPLKGPVLAELAHGELGVREFQDLDILIERNDLPKAKEVLRRRGFLPEHPVSETTEEAWLRSCNVRTFLHHESRAAVELHWELTPPWFAHTLTSRQLKRRLVRIATPGGPVWSFAKEELILYLCVHGAKHCWERLGWLCDLAALLRRNPDIEWDRLLSECRAQGNERILLLGIALAAELLGSELPGALEVEIRTHAGLRGLVDEVRHRLFGAYRPWPAALDDCLFHLQASRRWRDRISYCLRRTATFNERDWALRGRGVSVPFLDYALRAARLTSKLCRETTTWWFLNRPADAHAAQLSGKANVEPDVEICGR